MSAKHTPGPWELANGNRAYAPGEAGSLLATIHDLPRAPGQAAGNARLIAAAPELLEALQLAYVYLNGGPGYTANNRLAAYSAARSAIAKATGGAK